MPSYDGLGLIITYIQSWYFYSHEEFSILELNYDRNFTIETINFQNSRTIATFQRIDICWTSFEMFSPQTYENKAEQIWSTIPPKLPLFYQDSFLMISNQLLKKKNILWNFSDKTITLKKLKYCTFLIWFTF
jgi:hypothetical protein